MRDVTRRQERKHRIILSGAATYARLSYDVHAMFAARWCASARVDSRDPVVDSVLIAGRIVRCVPRQASGGAAGARPALAGHVHVADPEPPAAPCWKLSADPQFIDKVRDVVGLYMAPPENTLVLCVDEKSQIQALDRTASILPMLPTTPARMTHDYVRNGTTSLFAAFDLASGSVIAQSYRRRQPAPGRTRRSTPDTRPVPQRSGLPPVQRSRQRPNRPPR